MSSGTVVEVTEVFVEPPLFDGAPAWIRRLAICSTFENACTCARQTMTERADYGGILYYALQMIVLDTVHQTTPTAIFDGRDKLRGMIAGDREKAWEGRAPEDCRYRPRDLVGFVSPYEEVYRVGLVLALPPTPEAARRGRLTVGDDLYLVGMLDQDGSPECIDHAHLSQPLLFPVEHELAPATRVAPAKRIEGTGDKVHEATRSSSRRRLPSPCVRRSGEARGPGQTRIESALGKALIV